MNAPPAACHPEDEGAMPPPVPPCGQGGDRTPRWWRRSDKNRDGCQGELPSFLHPRLGITTRRKKMTICRRRGKLGTNLPPSNSACSVVLPGAGGTCLLFLVWIECRHLGGEEAKRTANRHAISRAGGLPVLGSSGHLLHATSGAVLDRSNWLSAWAPPVGVKMGLPRASPSAPSARRL